MSKDHHSECLDKPSTSWLNGVSVAVPIGPFEKLVTHTIPHESKIVREDATPQYVRQFHRRRYRED